MDYPPLTPENNFLPSQPAQPDVSWGFSDIIAGIVVFALMYSVVLGTAFVTMRLSGMTRLDLPSSVRPIVGSIAALFFEASLLVPVWVIAIVRRHASWAEVGYRAFTGLAGCVLPFLFLFLAFFASGVWGFIIQLMHWDTQQSLTSLFDKSPASITIGFVAVAIVAPMAEEGFFRGFVTGGLRKRFGAIGALLIGAAFFAVLHPPFTIFPIIFTLGVLLGLLFQTTGSLWPGIVMHAMFNTLGFVAQFYLERPQ